MMDEMQEKEEKRRKERARRYAKRYRERHGNRHYQNVRKYLLKTNYGVDETWYNVKFSNQQGKCAICDRTENRKLSVDHNHTTGKVRGLLCRACNIGLGCFKDNQETLLAAIGYLKEYD